MSRTKQPSEERKKIGAADGGPYLNTGDGHHLHVLDIRHPDYVALVEPDMAFWSLVRKGDLADLLSGAEITAQMDAHATAMSAEMKTLRFGLTPSAVYFNPTDRCNLNCTYCYIPERIRKDGADMSWPEMKKALLILKEYFSETMDGGRKPQIVFHGSEPLVNKGVVFKAIEEYHKNFQFGIQTNATLLDKEDARFLMSTETAVGISLDGHIAAISDRHRKNWAGQGTFKKAIKALEMFKGYERFSVICTVTTRNIAQLSEMIDFLHENEVGSCLLNQVRCTLKGGRASKPSDSEMAGMFIKALDRTYDLYQETGRKLVVANFANIILAVIAPSARRLMCDINPCGGGRCFFAVSARGDLFPCSEFIGLPRFKGGNLFKDPISEVLQSGPFKLVTGRRIENITPCDKCAIRHFCGAPCPAEAWEINGAMDAKGAFCEFYEEQVRYALRLIADKKESAYLWDNWDRDTEEMFRI